MAASGLGLTALALEYGFVVEDAGRHVLHLVQIAVVAAFILDRTLRLAAARAPLAHLRDYWFDFALLLLFIVLLLLVPPLGAAFVVLVQSYVAAVLILEAVRFNARLAAMSIRPAAVVLGSFALLILGGTLALMMPRASARPEAPIGILEALFTATSAACVTGLTVRDTAGDFSSLGQWIILVLFQLGGLGIVTYTSFFGLLQQRSLHLRHSLLLRDMLSAEVIGEVGRLLGAVMLVTFLAEGVGAVFLWWLTPEEPNRLWWAVFHSVSAFCNAGFSGWAMTPDSTGILLTILTLMVIGGLGFPTLLNLWSVASARTRSPGGLLSGTLPPRPRFSVHSKIVLTTSALLLLMGAAAFLLLERNHLLESRGFGKQVLLAFFQSGVARTSGFSAVDLENANPATQVVVMGLMVVGASPASTGGGIKTVTLAILMATLWAMLRNRQEVEIFRRSVPRLFVNAAVSISLLYGMAAFSFSLILSILHPTLPYRRLVFETVSALSTVGLSTGATMEIGGMGRLVLIAAMYVGRVGPLVVLMSIAGRAPSGDYRYPSEGVIVS
ncbi:MAG: hypothetical protein HY716_05105 [Planctomycetes bacterium]|nr:hypothetical protein [Planctomycetota bacterium]